MTNKLSISSGQYSDKGRKSVNQDFHGLCCPNEPLLDTKGISVALADGISSSNVSQEASETAISSFLDDYYSTSEAWSVKKSVQSVLSAVNSWLYSQTRRSEYRYNRDKGYVCTFSGIVFKSTSAHLFHIGDSRICRINSNSLEVLTQEHRVQVSEHQHYLKRAMGMDQQLEFDYSKHELNAGDVYVLMTDGIYEYVSDRDIVSICSTSQSDPEQAAGKIAQLAYDNGSADNLTVQIVRVVSLPEKSSSELYQEIGNLPFPPTLEPRMQFDGYTIVRALHNSARSHVVLAVDNDTQEKVVLKAPASELKQDKAHLERLLLEEWIARRINSPHVLQPCKQTRKKNFFYIALEYVEGQTLAQWMTDHPNPGLDSVRNIIDQTAKGLLAFHRLEMLHQDLRPQNIMIDSSGTVKIIDFGSARVAGLQEMSVQEHGPEILGTAQYTAPEYFIGEFGTSLSDQFSLAVIAYQMLSGRLPYGTEVSRARTLAAQRRLQYKSVLDAEREIPAWIDLSLRKALNPNPLKRYEAISAFLHDLRHPNSAFVNQTRPPLLERNPVVFWQGVSAVLLFIIIALLYWR